MKIEEKYSEITLDGAREMYSSIYNLDDNVTIGEIKQFMAERTEQLEKVEQQLDERLENMVGKYYSISYTNLNTKPSDHIFLCYVQQKDGFKLICKSLQYYCGNIEYSDDYYIITHDKIESNDYQTVREITKDDFDRALEKYRTLQTDVLKYK